MYNCGPEMIPSSARLLPEAKFWTLLFLTLGLLNEDDSWGSSDPLSLPQRISQSCDGGIPECSHKYFNSKVKQDYR